MNKFFSSLPKAILRQVVIRTCLGVCFVVLFAVLLGALRDIFLSLPCAVMAVFLLGSAGLLLHEEKSGKVICIQGECLKIEKSLFRLRNKSVYLVSGNQTLKVIAFATPRRIVAGDPLCLYLKKSARIYVRNGECMVSEYIALVKTDAK